MVTTRRDERYDLVVHFVHGSVSLQQLTKALDVALDLGLSEGLLWNVVDGDLSELSLRDLEQFAARMMSGPWAPLRCAVLSKPGATLAAGALLATLASESVPGERVRVFQDGDAALRWLRVEERPTTPILQGHSDG